ncbi:MAG: hypothetical protein WBJ84_09385 [Bacteroidales bacterium]
MPKTSDEKPDHHNTITGPDLVHVVGLSVNNPNNNNEVKLCSPEKILEEMKELTKKV